MYFNIFKRVKRFHVDFSWSILYFITIIFCANCIAMYNHLSTTIDSGRLFSPLCVMWQSQFIALEYLYISVHYGTKEPSERAYWFNHSI